jgi:predicted lactoylglutathione lyase
VASIGRQKAPPFTKALCKKVTFMFSHTTVGCKDLKLATNFYNSILQPLGYTQREVTPDGGPPSSCWIDPSKQLPRFYVYIPLDGNPASVGNGSMIAFLATSIEAVNAAYKAGIEAGGKDEGAPGERPHYGKGYYGAYLRDLDGNYLHIVFRGDII